MDIKQSKKNKRVEKMISRHSKRQILVSFVALIGLIILNSELGFLMSGGHALIDYVFGQYNWSLLGSAQDQIFILTLNLQFIFSYMSFFWIRRLPTNDDIGKATLYVLIFASLVGLFLAFSRIGIVSRAAFLVTIGQTILCILGSNWVVLKFRPFVLIDCSEPPLRDSSVNGATIQPLCEWASENREIEQKEIDGIIVEEGSRLAAAPISVLVASGTKIFDRRKIREQMLGRVELDDQTTLESCAFSDHEGYLLFRRVTDIFVSLIVIPLSAVVLFFVGVLIRIEGPGPFLFVQKRVGRGGRSFNLYKLRTMIPESRPRPTFASANSHRITRIGRLARRWRIDEIPQFWNVLIGDMTLIGPRPEQVEFVSEYEAAIPFYGLRHRVRPGLTGWAQVKQGYAEGQGETRIKLAYDVYYIKHASPWLDSLILLKTFYFVIRGG